MPGKCLQLRDLRICASDSPQRTASRSVLFRDLHPGREKSPPSAGNRNAGPDNARNQHFQENIALADLAEQLGVNANYLGGLLHRLQKESFRAQLTRRRLLEAKEWLTTRYDCSISDVAFGCGFQDSNYFSMVFRRAFGITPTAYRRKQHGREVPNHSPSPQRETK